VDFFSTPGAPIGSYTSPSKQTRAEKGDFAAGRTARWFGGSR